MPRVPQKIVAQNRSPEEDVLTALLALAGLPDAATTSIANGTNSPRPDPLRTRLPCPERRFGARGELTRRTADDRPGERGPEGGLRGRRREPRGDRARGQVGGGLVPLALRKYKGSSSLLLLLVAPGSFYI